MENQFNDTELIESFLENSLNNEDIESFNQRLETDKSFAEKFAQRKLFQSTYIKAYRRIELKKQIRSIISEEKRNSTIPRRVWLAAASLILLLGIGSFLLIQSRQSGDKTMAANGINLSEDKEVSSTENNIPEYGSVDSVSKKQVNPTVTFLPPEGAVFQQTDTIRFYLKNMDSNTRIIILDKTGSVVKKISVNASSSDYKIMPNALKPDNYLWFISNNESVKHSFIIK